MERLKKIVVDASVAVKWFAPEPHYERALALREAFLIDQIEMAAPSLIIYEVANALRFHRIYRFSSEEISNAIRSLLNLKFIKQLRSKAWIEAVLLSMNKDVSIYDSVYAALAIDLKATLITSDKELYKKLGDEVAITLLENVEM
ncbi:MAG: type II toxin-antitoxin system VapC family toxin [Candidatus Nezhaarchaeales archaeon]